MTIATNCTDQMVQLLKDTNLFGNEGQKVFAIYSEEDLMDKSKLVKFPSVGVMYEGVRSDGNDPTGQGMSGSLRVAVVLLLEGKVLGVDMRNVAAEILDTCRKAIRMQKAPTGHKWAFVEEVPAGKVGNLNLYLQRWVTKAILTSG